MVGYGCAALFALPFAAVAAWMAWSLAATVWTYYDSQSWRRADAEVVSTELLRTSTDGGVSYRVEAEYRYEVDGQTYTGDRVSLASAFESDSFARRLHERLESAKAAGKTVTVWVDPESPERALIDRDLRWRVVVFHLPFVICFGLFGFGLLGGLVYVRRKERRDARRLARQPGEPWRMRADWETGVIRSSDASAIAAPAIFATFWNGLTVPMAVVASQDDTLEWWAKAFLGLFVLIGAVMAGFALYRVARYLRHGASVLRLANTPGVVGGELAGVVLAPAGLRQGAEFRVKLACLQTRRERDSDGETRVLVPVWEDERLVERTLHDPSGKAGVPLRFTIPSDALPSAPDADLPVVWRLSVAAQADGPDYLAEFDVPVYRTPDSREGVVADGAPLTEYETRETLAARLAREGIRCDEGAGAHSLRLVCPPGRSWKSALAVFAVGVVFLGVGVGVGLMVDEWVRWVIAPTFGLLGAAVAFCGIGLGLGCSEVRIDGDDWLVRSGWYGLRGAGVALRGEDIRRIGVEQAMSESGGSSAAKKWNHVVATLKDGRKLTLVRYLLSRSTERELLEELRRRAGGRAE
ncbi:DUF3592 domain-containing protein [Botrimarina sp.]|uniref:DUF3592 domain-containing protein n=1 Tax=Botrimarina sp. TaxID=2795802 RepID=UPI0032EBFF0C